MTYFLSTCVTKVAISRRIRRKSAAALCILAYVLATQQLVQAGTGYDVWLRYEPITESAIREQYAQLPAVIHRLGDSQIAKSAEAELIRGMHGMLSRNLRNPLEKPAESAILLGSFAELPDLSPEEFGEIPADSFCLRSIIVDGKQHLLIAGQNERGILYGVFTLLRKIASDKPDSHTSSRKWIRGIALRNGDEIVLAGHANSGERAGVDYIIVRPQETSP